MASIQRPALPAPRILRLPRTGRWLMLVAALVVGVAMLQVNQFSRLASTGYEMERLKAERDTKLAVNHELEAEVAGLSSLARVDIEARVRLEMVPASRKLYIEVHHAVPGHDSLPTRYLPPAEPQPPLAEDEGTPIWKRARGWLPF